ncbi:SGNH/GDSL hydrolase family protein [Massilia orientalis]|uniref:esterase n=1 Tax=Massilia orientalis TaxID=3050128 RepID=UPI0037DC86F5
MAVVSGCGGGDSSTTTTDAGPVGSTPVGGGTAKPTFAAQVTFGDSLVDVGSYAVGGIQALGGGKYTINGNNTTVSPALDGKTWTEVLASQLKLPAPCAAQTGLEGDAAKGFSIPVTNHGGCFAYAQGGARVSNPVGPGNRQTGSTLGLLTLPVAAQVANHLAASGGKFKGDEIVVVMAGSADALAELDKLKADATAAGEAAGKEAGDRVARSVFALSLTGQLLKAGLNSVNALRASDALIAELAKPDHTPASLALVLVAASLPQPGDPQPQPGGTTPDWPFLIPQMIATATADATAAAAPIAANAAAKAGADYADANGPRVVTAMTTAAADLAALVKTSIVGKGAKYVVVNNLPDLTISPFALAQPASSQDLIKQMVTAFNDRLKADLAGQAGVLLIDVASVSRAHAADSKSFGLTSVTTPACGANALGAVLNSLVCNASNTIGGDVSHFMFADGIYPTPFEHSLIAKYVADQMTLKGWL